MKTKKKKNKPVNRKAARVLNAIKLYQNELQKLSLCVCYSGANHSQVFRLGKPIQMNQSLAFGLENIRTYWTIVCGVIHRKQDKSHYVEYIQFGTTQEYTSDDLHQIVKNITTNLFIGSQRLTHLCPFWIASPSKTDDIDLSLLAYTLHKHQILNHIGSNFEINCNLPFVDYHKEKEWFELHKEITFEELERDISDLMQEPPESDLVIGIPKDTNGT